MEAQLNRNMKVMDTVKPIGITESAPGVYILDMGQNMVGWLRMKVKGQSGDTLKLRFAECCRKTVLFIRQICERHIRQIPIS